MAWSVLYYLQIHLYLQFRSSRRSDSMSSGLIQPKIATLPAGPSRGQEARAQDSQPADLLGGVSATQGKDQTFEQTLLNSGTNTNNTPPRPTNTLQRPKSSMA